MEVTSEASKAEAQALRTRRLSNLEVLASKHARLSGEICLAGSMGACKEDCGPWKQGVRSRDRAAQPGGRIRSPGPCFSGLCLRSQSTRLGDRQNSSKKLFKLESAALKSAQKFRQVTKFRQLSAEMGRSWESQRTPGR